MWDCLNVKERILGIWKERRIGKQGDTILCKGFKCKVGLECIQV